MFELFKWTSSSPKQIHKTVKKLTEPAGEQGPRIEAAEKLADLGTPDALYGLAKRFTIASRVITEDIEEKRMVVRFLVDAGRDAVAPLVRFMKNHHQVDWAVRALEQILPREQLLQKLGEVLETVGRSEFSAPEHRASLIRSFHDRVSPNEAEVLRQFLTDSDDDVRLAAIDVLEELGEGEREFLLAAFTQSEDRPRIRIRIAEVFAEREWPVKGFRPTVEQHLPDGFLLTSKGLVRKR